LTIIALGTSLPELVTSVTATRKGQFDIAIGNVVGSNIFNIGIVIGIPITIFGGINQINFNPIDLLVFLGSSILLFLYSFNDHKISKKEGISFLIIFIIYYSYVIYMVDNSANSWLHWISKDVKETELEQGWADTKEYKGPYPPDGTHEYEIYVIALKNPVSELYGTFDKGNMTFEKNKYNCDITDDGESGNILAVGTLTGTYTAGE
jgi:hypothetical protein